jgi:hypothetical protein
MTLPAPANLPIEFSAPRNAAGLLSRMLAASPQWQALTTGRTLYWPPDVPAGVFLRSVPVTVPAPWASIQAAQDLQYKLVAGGSQNFLRPNGSLLLILNTATPPEHEGDTIAAEHYGLDAHAAIIESVIEQSGQDDLLTIIECNLLAFGPPPVEDQPAVGMDFESVWQIRWGDE